MVVVTVGGESYYINKTLKGKWDELKDGQLKNIDEDRVYIVDGRERSGKSVFTLQQAAYIDPSIIKDTSRITFSAEQTLEKIRTTRSTKKETKVIVFDEAFRGLSSKSALSKTNKKIVQALMEMGQSNLVLFLVSPSFFLLELYSAVLRSNTLFHIVKDKSNKRSFRAFNYRKKARLYNIGIRKGWGYKMHTRYRDWFFNKYPGGDAFEKLYREMKRKAIREMDEGKKEDVEMTPQQKKEFLKSLIKNSEKCQVNLKTKDLAQLFGLTQRSIQYYKREMPVKSEDEGTKLYNIND